MINIEQNKKQIEELLRSTEREGMENILEYMENNGYYTAPCSTQYHLCEEGGLAEHSLSVYNFAHDLYSPDEYHTAGFCLDTGIKDDSLKIVCLLHDIGKSGYRGEDNYIKNMLKTGISKSKPYKTNPDKNYISHEILSLMIINQCGLALTKEEEFAILQHNGMYGNLKNELMGKEQPLQQLLHFADMWSSRFLEKE